MGAPQQVNPKNNISVVFKWGKKKGRELCSNDVIL